MAITTTTTWRNKTKEHRPEFIAKAIKAVRLRERGLTYAQTAKLVGYHSKGACWTAVVRYTASQSTLHHDDFKRYQDS